MLGSDKSSSSSALIRSYFERQEGGRFAISKSHALGALLNSARSHDSAMPYIISCRAGTSSTNLCELVLFLRFYFVAFVLLMGVKCFVYTRGFFLLQINIFSSRRARRLAPNWARSILKFICEPFGGSTIGKCFQSGFIAVKVLKFARLVNGILLFR